jgi:hypothetical protein
MRKRLSYANVMATIAVFVALGGSSYAAVTLTGKDIEDGTITGRDVKDKSLTAKDLTGTVAGPQGKRGKTGKTGAAGAVGAAGLTGAQGAQGIPGPKGDTPAPGPRGYAKADGTFDGDSDFYLATDATHESPTLTATRDLTCLVISTIQTRSGLAHPDGTVTFRNAAWLDAVPQHDGEPGQYLVYDPDQAYYQAPVTRSSVIEVPAGKTFQFGVYLQHADEWTNASVSTVTSYACD